MSLKDIYDRLRTPGVSRLGPIDPRKGLQLYRTIGEETAPVLQDYVTTGREALGGVRAMSGLEGPEAYQRYIDTIRSGPEYTSMIEEMESAALQNAAATGGLRGGNIQSALMKFRPQLLSSLIDKQYGRLSGLSTQGGNVGQYLTGLGRDVTGRS